MNKTLNAISILSLVLFLSLLIVFWVVNFTFYTIIEDQQNSDSIELGCGTESPAILSELNFEHEAREIVEMECTPCHSIFKDELLIGPSLCYDEFEIQGLTLSILLLSDPKKELENSIYYNSLEEKFGIKYHRKNKYETLSKSDVNQFEAYLDTLRFIQQ